MMMLQIKRKRMKGTYATLFYGGALVLIFFIIGAFVITPTFARPKDDSGAILVNNIVYALRDSLELSKLYIDTSARYSLYQAAYDNAKNGGFADSEPRRTFTNDGSEYVVWYDGKDFSPSQDSLEKSLEIAAGENFKEYMKVGGVTAIFPVTLPSYGGLDIENVANYSVMILSKGDADLSLKRVTGNEHEITVERSSDIEMEVEIPYFQLAEEAKALQKEIEEYLSACEKGALEVSRDSWCCSAESEIINDSAGLCLVKVEVVTKKKFLVQDEDKTVFSPIRLVFTLLHEEEQPVSEPAGDESESE